MCSVCHKRTYNPIYKHKKQNPKVIRKTGFGTDHEPKYDHTTCSWGVIDCASEAHGLLWNIIYYL